MTAALHAICALALDCQTTGANAARDHLIELGWARIDLRAEPWPMPEAFLLRPPPEYVYPARLTRMSGLSPQQLQAGLSRASVWQRLVQAAESLDGGSHRRPVVVIHYARFEKPFLQALQVSAGDDRPFPFGIVCTHEIARRLLPGLPRRGLNALMGYYGFQPPEKKRAGQHAAATRQLWVSLLAQLAAEGIETLDALEAWLAQPLRLAAPQRVYPMPPECRRNLPDAPGVYRMRRANGDLLYVGKARSLKARVKGYFHTGRCHPEHILEMLTQAQGLEYSCTTSALAAALQEAEEIQRWDPPYNRQLRRRLEAPVCCTRDFQITGSTADHDLPLGPFPSLRALHPMAFLVRLSAGIEDAPQDRAALADLLGRPATYVPEPEIFAAGLKLFRSTLAPEIAGNLQAAACALRCLGATLWRGSDLKETPTESEAAAEAAGLTSETRWTPEAVAGVLEGVARRGAHLARRGRWFRLLRGARLCWAPRAGEGPNAVAHGDLWRMWCDPALDEHLPVFSAEAYDRLRVFTTELRRLVAEERDLALVLAAGPVLTRRRLKRILAVI